MSLYSNLHGIKVLECAHHNLFHTQSLYRIEKLKSEISDII
uniref:Uncharacterized protein n=1 Tax=Anguilla anguilla TaxID=7936 RepID=A0A0E9R3Z3_ANGAN